MTARKIFLIVAISCLITMLLTAGAVRWWLLRAVQPVALSAEENLVVDQKLQRLGYTPTVNGKAPAQPNERDEEPQGSSAQEGKVKLEPTPYTEDPLKREVTLSERELNGLLARDPEFADRVLIDLSPNLASTTIMLTIPEDFPLFSGTKLRINSGLELKLRGERPVVVLRGVSVMGVPLPNAWLGGLKNIDLVETYGNSGFWQAFANGLEKIDVREGEVYFKLKQ